MVLMVVFMKVCLVDSAVQARSHQLQRVQSAVRYKLLGRDE